MNKISRNSKTSTAFSLIELSIVILVVGIIIAGAIRGSDIIVKFRIRTAQTLTQSSPVAVIKNLAMWLETSMDNSVTIDSSSTVTQWNDINPQSTYKVNASQTYNTLPTYVENVINGLPVVQFATTAKSIKVDPTGNSMNFLANTNYTIFVVEQRVVSGNINGNKAMFLRGSGSGASKNLQYGYWHDGFIANDWLYDWKIPVTLSSVITPRIHVLKFDTAIGKYYSMRSNISAFYSVTNSSFLGHPLISYNGAAIGGDVGSIDISIAEMIVFTRALKSEEISAIESYLGKKYAVNASQN